MASIRMDDSEDPWAQAWENKHTHAGTETGEQEESRRSSIKPLETQEAKRDSPPHQHFADRMGIIKC
jgi:hypothetical protein